MHLNNREIYDYHVGTNVSGSKSNLKHLQSDTYAGFPESGSSFFLH